MTESRHCANCGAKLRAEASFCLTCGSSTRPVADVNCPTCGNDNTEDALLCGGCGASLSASPVTGSTPQDMDAERQEDTSPVAIPDDAIVIRQSNWAYLLPAVPWLVLFGVSLAFDFFTFGILPAIFATYFIGSRYLSIRRTAYILTDGYVIIQQGSLMGQNRIDLSFADLDHVLVQPGMFGRSLGYTRVSLQLKEGRMVFLHYVPLASPLLEYLQERMNP